MIDTMLETLRFNSYYDDNVKNLILKFTSKLSVIIVFPARKREKSDW